MKNITTVTDTEIRILLPGGAEIRIHDHQNGIRVNAAGFNHNLAIEPIQANSILVVPVKNGLRDHKLH